jgi:hypothetical protein
MCNAECNTALRKKINQSVPLQQKVDMKEITTPKSALLMAQNMEETLTKILLALKAAARRESDVSS